MKKWYILFFYIILFLPIPKLFAQPDDFNFSAGGEERFRIEFRNNFDFNKDADDKGYLAFQRLRINSKLTYKKTLTLFVEGMDLREFCDGIKKTGQADEFDLNQAYLEYKNSLARIKIGRQELSYGDERIIAAPAWANKLKPFDIIRSSLFLGNLTAEVFDGNPVLYDNHNFNDAKGHEYVSGAYLNYKDKACVISDIELLYLGDTDNDNLIKGEDNGWGKLNQHTIDLLLKGPLFSSGISYDAEYAYQFGKYATNEIKDAYALHADLRREFNLPLKPELKIEYNNASGDKDPGDGKTNTFIPAYQTTHAPYGIMDFFRWQNMREAAASIKLNPGKNISLTPGVNCFWLDEKRDSWYKSDGTKVRTATTGDISSYVGTEASLVANYKINKYISFESGYAHFFTGNYVKDTGPSNDADFAYAQTKICF